MGSGHKTMTLEPFDLFLTLTLEPFNPSPQITLTLEPFLAINCSHLLRYNQELYSQLVRYPQEVIPTLDIATNDLFFELYPNVVLDHQIQVGVARGSGGCD